MQFVFQYINSEQKAPEAWIPQSTYRFLRTVWSLTYNKHVYTLSQRKNMLVWKQFKCNSWKLHFTIWLFDEVNNDLIKTLRPHFTQLLAFCLGSDSISQIYIRELDAKSFQTVLNTRSCQWQRGRQGKIQYFAPIRENRIVVCE